MPEPGTVKSKGNRYIGNGYGEFLHPHPRPYDALTRDMTHPAFIYSRKILFVPGPNTLTSNEAMSRVFRE
jgi:hypothetical protein